MKLTDLAELVKRMRDSQKAYFRERSPQLLNVSKDWERRLDKEVEAILNPKAPGLFDEPIKEQQ